MAAYIFTTSPWPKEAISLGSIVRYKQTPHQEIIVPDGTVEQQDFTVMSNIDFEGIAGLESQIKIEGKLTCLWKRICSIFLKSESKGSFHITAKEARMYSLTQPTAIFEKLCEKDEVRKFFRDCHRQGIKPAFVTAYRTLIDAKVEYKKQSASAASASGDINSDIIGSGVAISKEGNDDRGFVIRTEKEAIYAINFLNVVITVSRARSNASEPAASLSPPSPSGWVVFSNIRGKPAEEEVMEVSLGEDSMAGESDLEYEDEHGRFYLLPEDDDSSDEE